MAGTGAGKGSRPRKVDLKRYGSNFDAIFSKSRNKNSKTSAHRMDSQLANS